MFDRVFVMPAERPRVEGGHKTVRVVEQRAPTDESIKIFRELVDAAKAEVVASIKVADTDFACVVHAERDDASGGDVILAAVFSLAGQKQRVVSRTPADATPQDRYEALVGDVSRRIAEVAVRPALLPLLEKRAPLRGSAAPLSFCRRATRSGRG